MPETKFAFGLVPHGAIATHTFWLKNTTDSTVQIDRTDAGCSCTRMPLKTKQLEPGDSVAVTLYLDTGKLPMRAFRKRSQIYLKDANSTKLEFLLTGVCYNAENATLKLSLEAPFARFSIGSGDTLISFGITNATQKDFRARLVSVPHESPFDIQLPNRQLMPGRTESIRFHLKPERRKYPFDESITIYITDKNRTRFTIPVVMTER